MNLSKNYTLVTTVPETHADLVREALGNAGAGTVGNYSHCSFSVKGIGRFIPKKGANPYLGKEDALEEVIEERIEVSCSLKALPKIIEALKKAHPYEEPMIDLYPLHEISSLGIQEIAENYANLIWKNRDFSKAEKLLSDHITIHSSLGTYQGIDAMKKIVEAWWKGFPDLTVINHSLFSEEDLVTIHWSAHGTHQGEFKGAMPSGKKVFYQGVTVYRIKAAEITEYWAYLDMQHILNQIK